MRLVELVHHRLERLLSPGDACIDATAGRGRDTLFIAGKIAPEGKVFAFDVQSSAIRETREALYQHGLEKMLHAYEENHAEMKHLIPQSLHGKIKCAVFNLGYLPGGNRSLATIAKHSVRAVESAYEMLQKEGILSVLCYRGHSGGKEEAESLEALCSKRSWKYEAIAGNDNPKSPQLLWVERC